MGNHLVSTFDMSLSCIRAIGAMHLSIAAAMAAPTTSQIKGAYFGALVADSLSLGSHYEYDAAKIKQAYGGNLDKFLAPGEMMGGETHGVGWGQRNYHPGTVAGDQTDYGEYNVLVLEYLAQKSPPTIAFATAAFFRLSYLRMK